MQKAKEIIEDQSGDMVFMLIGLVLILLCMSAFFGEIFKMNSINDNLNDELNRAVNLSVKGAMYDSYRQDKENKMDADVAKIKFYNYLHNDMKLNNALEKYSDGQQTYVYKIVIKDITVDENARMQVEATAYVPVIFKGFMQWELPIMVKSRNMRVDGL